MDAFLGILFLFLALLNLAGAIWAARQSYVKGLRGLVEDE